jgi:cobalt/nickel transport system permease protein
LHLPDGIIPLPQALIYWIITLIFIAIYLFKLSKTEHREKNVVYTSIFAAATVATSSLSIPSPLGVPIHFFLIPLVAILMGPLSGVIVAFLCLVIQFFLMGMGGITTLGANTLAIGVAISVVTYFFYSIIRDLNWRLSIFSGTFLGIMVATIVQVLMLFFAGLATIDVLLASLIPFYLLIAVIEGFANVIIVSFLSKVKPDLVNLDKI